MKTVESNLKFAAALEALQQGQMVSRKGWNGEGMFIFRQIPSSIPITVVPNMQSLPTKVKNEFMNRYHNMTKAAGAANVAIDEGHAHATIKYDNQIAIVKPDNTIHGWSPSVADTQAEDWCVLDTEVEGSL